MYLSEVALVFILLIGHPASPLGWARLPTSLDAWLLILVTFYTLLKLNAAFLKEKWAQAMKWLSELDDRAAAWIEDKLKIVDEKWNQFLGIPKK